MLIHTGRYLNSLFIKKQLKIWPPREESGEKKTAVQL